MKSNDSGPCRSVHSTFSKWKAGFRISMEYALVVMLMVAGWKEERSNPKARKKGICIEIVPAGYGDVLDSPPATPCPETTCPRRTIIPSSMTHIIPLMMANGLRFCCRAGSLPTTRDSGDTRTGQARTGANACQEGPTSVVSSPTGPSVDPRRASISRSSSFVSRIPRNSRRTVRVKIHPSTPTTIQGSG